MVEHSTNPDKPGPPSKPTVKGKIHSHSVKVTWGRLHFVNAVFGCCLCTYSHSVMQVKKQNQTQANYLSTDTIIAGEILGITKKLQLGLFWGCSTKVMVFFIHFGEADNAVVIASVVVASRFTVMLK